MKLWASRQASGSYMLTALRPQLHEVGKTGHRDYYMRYGDPIGLRHLCENGFTSLTGLPNLDPLGQVRIELTSQVISPQNLTT